MNRDRAIDALSRYVTQAYPNRYPRMLIASQSVLVTFEKDEGLDGTRPFHAFLRLGDRGFAERIERARVEHERG